MLKSNYGKSGISFSSSSTGHPGPGDAGGKGALGHDVGVVPAGDLQGINQPPAYDDIFTGPHPSDPPTPTPQPSYVHTFPSPRESRVVRQHNYYRDDRNLWEKLHECFEMSALQQLIWLAVLAFSISYITFGSLYSGQCLRQQLDDKGKVRAEEDLTVFIRAEGGVVCATILIVFILRLLASADRRRSHPITKVDLEERKKAGGQIFFFLVLLYIVNFGVCVAGAAKIIPLYNDHATTFNQTVVKCDPEFYDFYYHAKIAQLAVFMPYAAYVLLGLLCVLPSQKRWFLRRKLRCWAKLLDADQDGVISQADMGATNAKLEELRRLFGGRTDPLSAADQEKWWNEHIFKHGEGKDISAEEYVNYMEGYMSPPGERDKRAKLLIEQWFKFLFTDEFLKKNTIYGELNFCKFWTILARVDESHSRKMYARNFPTPFTVKDFLQDFISLLSKDEFFDENSNRIFSVIKFQPKGICCKA